MVKNNSFRAEPIEMSRVGVWFSWSGNASLGEIASESAGRAVAGAVAGIAGGTPGQAGAGGAVGAGGRGRRGGGRGGGGRRGGGGGDGEAAAPGGGEAGVHAAPHVTRARTTYHSTHHWPKQEFAALANEMRVRLSRFIFGWRRPTAEVWDSGWTFPYWGVKRQWEAKPPPRVLPLAPLENKLSQSVPGAVAS